MLVYIDIYSDDECIFPGHACETVTVVSENKYDVVVGSVDMVKLQQAVERSMYETHRIPAREPSERRE